MAGGLGGEIWDSGGVDHAGGGNKSCPVLTRPWVSFQHGYYLALVAREYQLVMVKFIRRISSWKLFTSPTASHSTIVGWEYFSMCQGRPAFCTPNSTPYPSGHILWPSLLDHIIWLAGHLLGELTGVAVSVGGFTGTHTS